MVPIATAAGRLARRHLPRLSPRPAGAAGPLRPDRAAARGAHLGGAAGRHARLGQDGRRADDRLRRRAPRLAGRRLRPQARPRPRPRRRAARARSRCWSSPAPRATAASSTRSRSGCPSCARSLPPTTCSSCCATRRRPGRTRSSARCATRCAPASGASLGVIERLRDGEAEARRARRPTRWRCSLTSASRGWGSASGEAEPIDGERSVITIRTPGLTLPTPAPRARPTPAPSGSRWRRSPWSPPSRCGSSRRPQPPQGRRAGRGVVPARLDAGPLAAQPARAARPRS